MSVVDRNRRLAETRARADLARQRFITALHGTRRRVAPERLKEDALLLVGDKVDEAKQAARRSVARHPLLAASVIVSGVALIFWSPARQIALFGARVSQVVWMNRALWRTRE
ncbi:MAG TPA: hypothetical protein VFF84_13415 [Sphingobium sp.]|nr:hypothetical protein [Sphingobium sp.]